MSSFHRLRRLDTLFPATLLVDSHAGLRLEARQAPGEMPVDHSKTDYSQQR